MSDIAASLAETAERTIAWIADFAAQISGELTVAGIALTVAVIAAGGAAWTGIVLRRAARDENTRLDALHHDIQQLGVLLEQRLEAAASSDPVTSKQMADLQGQIANLHNAVHGQSRDNARQTRDIIDAVSNLRAEVVDQQTAKYRVNEAIRRAMSTKSDSTS